MTKRIDKLLVGTARELKEGRVPLNEGWLIREKVSINEAMDLAETLVSAIHVYRACLKLGVEVAGRADRDDLSLAERLRDLTVQQGGPFAILAEGVKMELEEHPE